MYIIKLKRHNDFIYPNIKTVIKEVYKNVEEFHFFNTYVRIKFFDKKEYLHLYNIISIEIKHKKEKE